MVLPRGDVAADQQIFQGRAGALTVGGGLSPNIIQRLGGTGLDMYRAVLMFPGPVVSMTSRVWSGAIEVDGAGAQ